MRTRAATALSAPSVRILGIGDQPARTFPLIISAIKVRIFNSKQQVDIKGLF